MNNLTLLYRIKMTGLIFLLILALILFGLFLLLLYVIMFIPMIFFKKVFVRYAFFFMKRTNINGTSKFANKNK